MKSPLLLRTMLSFLVAGLVLTAAAVLPLSASRAQPVAPAPRVGQPLPTAVDLNGQYSGSVKLVWGLTGVYSDSLATPTPKPAGAPQPPDLGSIDLTLQLSQSGTTVSGYVVLDNTIVFTREHTIQATPVAPTPGAGTPTPAPQPLGVGPYVNGTFDGTTLRLESEPFSLVVGGKRITRQFRLVTTVVPTDGGRLVGEYRETMSGYALRPATVLGGFDLSRPATGPTGSGRYSIYLPLVSRGANLSRGP